MTDEEESFKRLRDPIQYTHHVDNLLCLCKLKKVKLITYLNSLLVLVNPTKIVQYTAETSIIISKLYYLLFSVLFSFEPW